MAQNVLFILSFFGYFTENGWDQNQFQNQKEESSGADDSLQYLFKNLTLAQTFELLYQPEGKVCKL